MRAALLSTLTPGGRQTIAALFSGMLVARSMDNFVRVMRTRDLNDPNIGTLGFRKSRSRFSPLWPRSNLTHRFGIIYGAEDLATACYETIVRHRFDIWPQRVLYPNDYNTRSAVNISTNSEDELTLLDLTNGNAVRYGVPTDVIRYSCHRAGQYFSEFVHQNLPIVDGILYSSRFTERLCVAIYERAIISKLQSRVGNQLIQPVLSPALFGWNIVVR